WDFDWVLTDLMMPGDRINQGKGLEFVGQLGDYGNYVAWAALAKGVKHIGIVSDTGHHDHPAGHIAEIMPSTPQMKWFCGYHCPKIDMPDIPGGSVKNWAMAFSES
ncbi:MAG: hypothetical protein NTY66_03575, partial [Candidatus Vogelbacteria bacterium]|nr:hypothetical protein [Candidatus Vogelbacteria bacterium]